MMENLVVEVEGAGDLGLQPCSVTAVWNEPCGDDVCPASGATCGTVTVLLQEGSMTSGASVLYDFRRAHGLRTDGGGMISALK